MASLIPGYEYDIFISYRQKDNKGDRWVSEFVEALKTELESTFKEEISVYFDINPHDGLLETHDVDESLKDKLKCLIFIPIISRTYCDPKSFAWEHEFKAFIEQASKDKFGLKVKLPNGNVANRVLPVRIHDLDNEDLRLCESVLGGFLRGVEFIYKESGVNRPLIPKDKEGKNLNKTNYRNQINKVALAIREIISSMCPHEQDHEAGQREIYRPEPLPQKNYKVKIIAGTLILLALMVLGYFFVPQLFKPLRQLEKSIAVLPFINDSPDQENAYFINGIMEEVLNNLQKIKAFRVLSRTSVEQYRDSEIPTIPEIAKDLDVNYVVEGSGQKYGNSYRLRVQLIDAKNDKHLWAESYEKEIKETKDIYGIQSQIAQSIAAELKTIITPEEKKLIEKAPTDNLTAYDLCMKANEYQKDYQKTRKLDDYSKSVTFYKAALDIDSVYAKAYTGLASAYFYRYYFEAYFKVSYLDSSLVLVNKALSFDDQLDGAYYLKGLYFDVKGHSEEALVNYDKALIINPNYLKAYFDKGFLQMWKLHDFVNGIASLNKALGLIRGKDRPDLLRTIGRAYLDVGFIDKAKHYYEEALSLDKDSLTYFYYMAFVEFCVENLEEEWKYALKIQKSNATYLPWFVPPGYDEQFEKAYKEQAYLNAKKSVEEVEKLGILNLQGSHRVGYAFYQVGKKKEAEYYFDLQIKIGEESIKLGREIAQYGAAQYDLAATYAFIGEKEKAYKYLDEFSKLNLCQLWWITLAKVDPLFESIRNEERFQRFLRNMEAKHQAEHERVRKWLEQQGML